MTDHTVKAYGEELDAIVADISRMGGLAESMVADSVSAIVRRDAALARAVIERDPKVDAVQRDVERKVLRVFALRQPMAKDLRETLSAMKLANDIERIGKADRGAGVSPRDVGEIHPTTRAVGERGSDGRGG